MLRGKKKITSNLDTVKQESRILRLLRQELGFQVSLTSVAISDKEDMYKVSQKEIAAALLEAEYQKAKAIMTSQQVRSFC
jgi:hypothetical protein